MAHATLGQCRTCKAFRGVEYCDWSRASPPRCLSCGGMLDRKDGRYHESPPKRKKKPPKPFVRMKATAMQALQSEAEIRIAAESARLRLETRTVQCGHRGVVTLHWFFVDVTSGRKVLDYWPGNGKWWSCVDGTKGFAANPQDALNVALDKADGTATRDAESHMDAIARVA
jgi:hypothetical protein